MPGHKNGPGTEGLKSSSFCVQPYAYLYHMGNVRRTSTEPVRTKPDLPMPDLI